MRINTVLDPQHKALGLWSSLSGAQIEKKPPKNSLELQVSKWVETFWRVLRCSNEKCIKGEKNLNQPNQSGFARGKGFHGRNSVRPSGSQIRPRFNFMVSEVNKSGTQTSLLLFFNIFNRLPCWKRCSVPAQPQQPNPPQCFPSQGLNTKHARQGG